MTEELGENAKLPHRIQIDLRFGDTDMQGHINNAVYATLYESGRVNFLYGPHGDLMPKGRTFVIAELSIRFVDEILYPGAVDVFSGVHRIGNSSVGLVQELRVNGQLKSHATSVVVMIDNAKRKSAPLDEATRARMAKLLIT
ncbi:MAG: thioesterase family protein [Pseudomonadota bacterium]